VILGVLDRVLYRHPFAGTSARRYTRAERPAFGDLDDRILDGLPLVGARRLLDVGAGPGTFATHAAARHPGMCVIALEPSPGFSATVRGRAEALPIADAAIDVAICLSSIRHVRDRAATLRELRRVVRPGGVLAIVELDPAEDPRRIATHADRLGSPLLRRAFEPLVVRTAPPVSAIEALARAAGWRRRALRDDPVQPVYVLELA
jgi:ubiquinone/menaquinone biosynthesis C-methylase UbiE